METLPTFFTNEISGDTDSRNFSIPEVLTHVPVASSRIPAAAPSGRRVVVAPTSHGRSFKLQCSYGPLFSLGQMLVLMDKQQVRPLEVVGVFFPLEKTRVSDRQYDRFYLGDRKVGLDCLALIVEIKIMARSSESYYRMLWPSGQLRQDWQPLHLERFKIITTEEQRNMISLFTGVVYKASETSYSNNQYSVSRQGHQAAEEAFRRPPIKHTRRVMTTPPPEPPSNKELGLSFDTDPTVG